ncbi:pseudouridine synthase [Bradyrhizobium sp. STM 3557]|uniref:pseudouridine synthase n=1 Tax=Bradyrhizobium sp. STM 3557 TaxID=578920 RepID=UPI0038906BF7
MPRHSDKDNASSRDRRGRPSSGKGRSAPARGAGAAKRSYGPKKDFGPKKEFGGKRDGERRPPRREEGGERSFRKRDDREEPGFRRRDAEGARPARRHEERGLRSDRGRDEGFRAKSRREEGGERSFRKREDREERGGFKRGPREDRGSDRFPRKRFDEDRPARSRGEGFRKDDRGPRKAFGKGPRKEFEPRDRSDGKPWQGRDKASRFQRDDERGERPRFRKPREDRGQEDRPKFGRPRFERSGENRRERGGGDWHEHPRSEGRFSDRPRRENEDDSGIFAKRPAFGGRGLYRERKPDADKRGKRTIADEAPKPGKIGERIAKVVARAGLASRRDAEEMITQGRVSVNGRVINSPALDVTENDVITVDGAPLPERERTRLFLYHKPRGLMTTHADPEGRPTVFDHLPEGLPRLISIGRLDFNTEGLLLLTNDGGLARVLELPDTGWLRRYRVRAHGEVTQAQLDQLAAGVEVDGVKYGPIEATLERDQGANVWLVVAIREGKNREVRNVLGHLGLEVNRLIRVSYGPFQLGELAEGEVQEIKTRVLREQLGEKVIAQAGADFGPAPDSKSGREQLPAPKPKPKREVVADRKGRRVLVQRTGSEEARARHEAEARFPGPPRRPKRGYHGKRDLAPRDE